MLLKPPLKKLFIVSLYTSPVISALTITPIFILNTYLLGLYTKVAAEVACLIFLIWAVNILLIWPVNKFKLKNRYYLLASYSMFIVFIPLFQMPFAALEQKAGYHQAFHFHLIIFFSINTVIIVIKDLILTREKNTAIELENSQLKMKNLEAVNERLKQQIHPHFLFNSLSTLKSLIATSPESAEEYLVKLSGFLRNSISSNTLNTVKIKEELNACIDYLEMQKIRFGEALQFEATIPEKIKTEYRIPILSLQVLAENAIKHNGFTIKDPIYILITFNENHIIVSNNIQQKNIVETSAGIGLANLDERYKILSGEGITVQRTDHTFSVSLKVFGNENYNNRG